MPRTSACVRIATLLAVAGIVSGCSLFWPPTDRTIENVFPTPEHIGQYEPLVHGQAARLADTSFPAGPFGKRVRETYWINWDEQLITEYGELYLEILGWDIDTWPGVRERCDAFSIPQSRDKQVLVLFSVQPPLGAVCVLLASPSELRHRFPEHTRHLLNAPEGEGTLEYPDRLYSRSRVLFMRRARGVAAVLDVIDLDSGQGILDGAVVGDGSVLFSHGDLGYTLTLDDGELLVEVVK